ncbi:MAG TPA: hypothetical protein VFF86_08180, partial [Candidatus Methylomirabilis sp.]|nr:hypothetical protein [Candidatus Methylomirabilis sp.]
VIDLPPMPLLPRYVMSEEQRELIAEIGVLGRSLAAADLDPEDREDIQNELKSAQDALRSVVERA